MTTSERRSHWENVFRTRSERDVSWFEESPAISIELILATGVDTRASIVDIGGGASRLVDALVERGFDSITVLDLSEEVLTLSRSRLGVAGSYVKWVTADVTTWQPADIYDIWHYRAAFHFLTEPKDRADYATCVRKAVCPGGHVIIGTFALDGPERCSGLPVARHDARTIGEILGGSFELAESRRHDHMTPGGAIQRFQFSRYRRLK